MTATYKEFSIQGSKWLVVLEGQDLAFIGRSWTELDSLLGQGLDIEEGQGSAFDKFESILTAYLAGHEVDWPLPPTLKGSPFQVEVWAQVLAIPYGQVRTYQDIAQAIGKPKAIRPVAHAIGQNPYLLAVPCHRVVGKDGSLRGYRSGLDMKQALLDLEQGLPFTL